MMSSIEVEFHNALRTIGVEDTQYIELTLLPLLKRMIERPLINPRDFDHEEAKGQIFEGFGVRVEIEEWGASVPFRVGSPSWEEGCIKRAQPTSEKHTDKMITVMEPFKDVVEEFQENLRSFDVHPRMAQQIAKMVQGVIFHFLYYDLYHKPLKRDRVEKFMGLLKQGAYPLGPLTGKPEKWLVVIG